MFPKRKSNDQSIGDAIKQMLKQYGLEEKLNQVKITSSWEILMGKTIARYTSAIYFKEGTLIVKLSSAALRQELLYAKSKIILKINTEIGKDIVRDIVFQ
jgi:predicted nucleic acid-binding Zn ribbon protein